MFVAVILCAVTLFCDRYGDFICNCVDCQGSFYFCDLVVGCFRSFIQCVCECVRAAALLCLASGHIVCCAFTCRKSIARHCHCVIRQCCAVVCLAVRCRGQCYFPLADLKRSIHDHKLYIRKVLARICEV